MGQHNGRLDRLADRWWMGPLFTLGHVPLALWVSSTPSVGAVMALCILAIGSLASLRASGASLVPLLAVAYMTGSERMWRTVGTTEVLGWEFCKSGVIVISLIRVLTHRGQRGTMPMIPLWYAVLLLPSLAALLGGELDFHMVRSRAIATLAGPISMALSALLFSAYTLDPRALRRVAYSVIGPIAGTVTLCVRNLVILGEDIQFGATSNREASGGGGPNQVANTLALGALLCWMLLLGRKLAFMERVFLFGLLLVQIIVMLLTLSRGGFYTFCLAVAAVSLVKLRAQGQRLQFLAMFILMAVVLLRVAWPTADRVASGAVQRRYSNLRTDRWELAKSEILVWMEHPLMGVGPGVAREEVAAYLGHSLMAHVEFSRLLAEHGIFGVAAILLFFGGFIRNYRLADAEGWRTWVVAAMAYTCGYWMQSATRTLAPSFTYGLIWTSDPRSPRRRLPENDSARHNTRV
ncbi:MAG: O-antigen ligase family protein [Acidobacteriota bacterium]